MSSRNPMNKRTQELNEGGRSGMARKSAGSAKPARAAASSVRVVKTSGKAKRQEREQGESLVGLSREEKRARKQERRLEEDRIAAAVNILMKEDPDYPRYRRLWWILLGVGIACILVVWVLMAVIGSASSGSQIAQIVGLVLAYAFIIAGFAVDLVKIRPIRNESRTLAESMSDAKIRRLIEQTAAEEDRRKAERKKR